MNRQVFFDVVLIILGTITFVRSEGSVIKTKSGNVMGRYEKSYEGRTFTAFEGIPYAKPPVGELRFKEPQPAEPWTDTLIANRTYICIQYTYIVPMKSARGNEDCLYLYVYVPRENITGDENLDVVVHIHGGAFIVGDPKTLAGPEYLMDRDVVYVSMNYRLGILGFLSTEDEVVSGNNGLKDQTLALKWIQENIKSFGGNPDSVTITGSSAGAACVHYHYFSPLSIGLFHRGFSQSGTAINAWALTLNPLQKARTLGQLFNCSTESTSVLVDCLKKIPSRELITATGHFLPISNALPSNVFAPTVEKRPGAFLPDHPYKLLMEEKFNDYPWITSNTVDEGTIPVAVFVLFKQLPEIEKHWNEISPFSLEYHETAADADKNVIAQKVKARYLRNEPASLENVHDLIKLYTDRLFLADAANAVRLQAKVAKSPVYYYLFDYHIEMPVLFKANLTAVGHGDDFKMLFHQFDSVKVLSDNDRKMKDIFVNFMYDFTTKGKPNVNGVEWEPVSPSENDIKFMRISSPTSVHMESAKDLGSSKFWDTLPLKENQHLFKAS